MTDPFRLLKVGGEFIDRSRCIQDLQYVSAALSLREEYGTGIMTEEFSMAISATDRLIWVRIEQD